MQGCAIVIDPIVRTSRPSGLYRKSPAAKRFGPDLEYGWSRNVLGLQIELGVYRRQG